MSRTNLEHLLIAAERLRPVLAELVLVGGAVTSLLVTDEGAGTPRTTFDVEIAATAMVAGMTQLHNSPRYFAAIRSSWKATVSGFGVLGHSI